MLINECCDNHIDAITQGSPFCWSHLWVKFMNGSKISITNTAVVSNIFKIKQTDNFDSIVLVLNIPFRIVLMIFLSGFFKSEPHRTLRESDNQTTPTNKFFKNLLQLGMA